MKLNELWFFSKVTVKDAVNAYFQPLSVVVAFLSIPMEIFKQAFTCLVMDSEEFQKVQESKLQEEIDELVASGLSTEDVEKGL